jgi:hypothetical protein
VQQGNADQQEKQQQSLGAHCPRKQQYSNRAWVRTAQQGSKKIAPAAAGARTRKAIVLDVVHVLQDEDRHQRLQAETGSVPIRL